MADYDAISKVIINAIRKEVDKQIDAAYRRGYADGKARIEPTIAKIKEYEERQTEKRCLTCGHCQETEDERLYCEIAVEKPMSCTDYAQWTPKQDEIHCNATDKEITGSFIEDVSEVKDQLPYKDDITIDQAIDNIKRGYGITHKHKTLTLAIKALRMMKEKQND